MCVSINGPGDLDLRPFDLETGVRVASEVENLPSEFRHARPLGSRIIRYVRDGRTDRRTKATLIAPFPTAGGIIMRIAELVAVGNSHTSRLNNARLVNRNDDAIQYRPVETARWI